MSLIKLFKNSLFFIVLAFSFQSMASQRLCHSGVITALSIGASQGGYVNGRKDGVEVQFNGRTWIPLSWKMNGDDPEGVGMISTLQMAFVLGYEVSLYDDTGTRCDDFNNIIVKK